MVTPAFAVPITVPPDTSAPELLIGRGWTYPVLTELLKTVYVQEALGHHGDDPPTMTDSRVSLLTGVHRHDVKRLRTEALDESYTPALRHDAGLAARVVAACGIHCPLS